MTNEPAVVQGRVLQPQKVLDPASVPGHGFANVMRRLVTQTSGVFKTEGELHQALDAIDAFERHLVPVGDRQHVAAEHDMAGREDVTKRAAPQTGAAVVPAGVPQIDYHALAQAILSAQQAQQAQQAQYVPSQPDGQESPSDGSDQ